MIWTVSNLIKEKPYIVKNTGLSKAKASMVITTFFKFAMLSILRGNKVSLPFGSSIAINKSQYNPGELPPLKRTRYSGVVEYATSPRGYKYKYSIVADSGYRFRQKDSDSKIKLVANQLFRSKLHQLLVKTKIDYQESWQ